MLTILPLFSDSHTLSQIDVDLHQSTPIYISQHRSILVKHRLYIINADHTAD
ncbi:hypothetical protein KI387_022097, partial [Taxus chinensis]